MASCIKYTKIELLEHYTFHTGEWQTAPWWSFDKMLSTRILRIAIKNNKAQLRFTHLSKRLKEGY
jgi:hypothetical protein